MYGRAFQALPERGRLQIEVAGIVQGVGMRPFVYRLARGLGLAGWVRNSGRGVEIEVEGDAQSLQRFLEGLKEDAPPLASISSLTVLHLPAGQGRGFSIVASSHALGGSEVSPDCDVCDDCLSEFRDPANRRYLYPFINCTNCGTRYSIINAFPCRIPPSPPLSAAACSLRTRHCDSRWWYRSCRQPAAPC